MPLPEPLDGSEPPLVASHDDQPLGEEATGPGPRRSRWAIAGLASAAVLALTGVTALIVGHLGHGVPVAAPGSSAQPSRSARYYACAQLLDPGVAPDDGYCGRMAKELMRRAGLTEADRARLAADVQRAVLALHKPGFCADLPRVPTRPGYSPPPQYPQCDGVPPRDRIDGSGGRRPDTVDARSVRLSLDRAGFPGSVVRIAGNDDPAPRGSILFGVPIGDACLVGFLQSVRGGGSYALYGRLPDGRCLSG
jgi:hypothetical protein